MGGGAADQVPPKAASTPRQRNGYSSTEDVPERLKRIQVEAGMSWSEIDRRIGIYRQTVWRLFRHRIIG